MMVRWRGRLVKLLLPLAVALLLAYTADQLLTGERGIVTWRLMHAQIRQLQEDKARLADDVNRLEREVARLKYYKRSPNDKVGKLDEDYVDERIRRNLPLIKVGERVIFVSEGMPEEAE